MSQHPSFKGVSKLTRHRSVVKRAERIQRLEKDGKWKEGDSVFGLPKVKILKIKIKKEKSAEATAKTAEGAASGKPAAGSAAPAKKEEKTDKKK